MYACYHRQTAAARAVKIVPRSAMADSDQEQFMSEINILKMMDHPNIVKLFEIYSDTKRYYLVTEYRLQRNNMIDCAREENCSTGW